MFRAAKNWVLQSSVLHILYIADNKIKWSSFFVPAYIFYPIHSHFSYYLILSSHAKPHYTVTFISYSYKHIPVLFSSFRSGKQQQHCSTLHEHCEQGADKETECMRQRHVVSSTNHLHCHYRQTAEVASEIHPTSHHTQLDYGSYTAGLPQELPATQVVHSVPQGLNQ